MERGQGWVYCPPAWMIRINKGRLECIGNEFISPHIDTDIIVIDGIDHTPVKSPEAVAGLCFLYQPAIGNSGEARWNGQVHVHAMIRLITPVVLAGKPYGSPYAFTSEANPVIPHGILF